MNVEFQWAMRSALAGTAAAMIPQAIRENFSLGEIVVVDCPIPAEGLIATNIAFVVAEKMKKICTDAVLPLDLAHALKEAMLPLHWDVHVSGPGFLNVRPTRQFFHDFLISVNEKRSSCFFSETSVFEKNTSGIQAIDVDWNSKYLHLSADDERYEKLFSRSDLETGGLNLMVLSLAADPELDVAPYLLDLAGRENVPWYLDRFERDSAQLSEGDRTDDTLVERFYNESEKYPYQSLVVVLRNFRVRFLDAKKRKRPELFMAALLDMARAFYSGYNRPEGREILLTDPASRWLVGLVREIVQQGLSLFCFPEAPSLILRRITVRTSVLNNK